MTPEAIQAVERFVSAFNDPCDAVELAPHLTKDQVYALANLLAEMGEPEVAVQWLMFSAREVCN